MVRLLEWKAKPIFIRIHKEIYLSPKITEQQARSKVIAKMDVQKVGLAHYTNKL